jgi:DNA repair protein RecN (Recombination protein N)
VGDPVIEELRIQGLGVIDEAVLELGPGLCVLTGETGAGKTLVVTGLQLLLGMRADAAVVRTGASRARIEGRIRVPAGPIHDEVASVSDSAGAELDEGSLILARTIAALGGSRAFAGGVSVPVSILSQLCEHLVAVHGQADQQLLRQRGAQRGALDNFAGAELADVLTDYRQRYARLRDVEQRLASMAADTRERAREADQLIYALAEIQAVAPQPGEDVGLLAEDTRLTHADTLRVSAEEARRALSGAGDDDGVDAMFLVAGARAALDGARAHDAEAGVLSDRLAEIGYLLADASADVASYAEGLESDPQRLACVQSRRAALGGLTRKYGQTVDDVLAWSHEAETRLHELDGSDETEAGLTKEVAQLRGEMAVLAKELTRLRNDAADALVDGVTRELSGLAMPNARLTAAITQRNAESGLQIDGRMLAFGADGVDEVEFLLASGSGATPRPVARGASGGELSRVMLALEVVLSDSDDTPTFVFDEVDAGVGGKAAVEVGRRLARLARSAQVLVVTHLPQVAAYADHHYVIVRSDDGTVTSAGVVALDDDGRVRELARMLAGQEDSATAAAHARELLASSTLDR